MAVHTKGLRVLSYDSDLEVLRLLTDRLAELINQRVQTVTDCSGCSPSSFPARSN